MSDDIYRRLAADADAEQLAQTAKKDSDRKAWLRVAEGWLDVAARGGKSSKEASGQAKFGD